MYHSFDQRIWFMVNFFLSKRAAFYSKYDFFFKLSYILPQFLLSWTELPKCTSTILMENCDQVTCLGLSIIFLYGSSHKFWCFKKFIFELEDFSQNSKIKSILVRQLKSLKKMVLPSAKFTILISWSPICIF